MEPAEDSTGLSSWANVTELSISPICSMMPSDTAMRNHSVIDHKITALRIIDKIGHFPWSHPYLGLSQIRRNLNRIFGVVRPVTRYNWRPACRNGLPKQLYHAADINDAGQIVGYGYNYYGQQHAFLLTPMN